MEVIKMRKKIYITGAQITNEQELHLQIEPDVLLTEIKPAGQMLVDSDDLSFVYLLEKDDDYTYLVIKDEFWPLLKKGIEGQTSVFLKHEDIKLELDQFFEELEYLVENIKGNSNYGETMVAKVEEVF